MLLLPRDPQRRPQRDHRDPGRHRRRGGRALRGRPVPHVRALRRAPPLEDGGAHRPTRPGIGGLQGGHLRGPRRRRLQPRSSSRAACTACSACRRPRRRAASTPRPRRWPCCPRPTRSTSRSTRQGPADRRQALVGPGRPERQHHRLGGAHHAPADRPRGRDPGREEPAQEQGQGDDGAARRACSRCEQRKAHEAEARDAAQHGRLAAIARRRSAPTTSRRTASPTTASARPAQPARRPRRRPRPAHRRPDHDRPGGAPGPPREGERERSPGGWQRSRRGHGALRPVRVRSATSDRPSVP